MRAPLATLWWIRHRIFYHQLASIARESRLKVAFVSISAVLLWLGSFVLCRRGLWLLLELGDLGGLGESSGVAFGDLILARLFSVFALALFMMLIVSNVLVAYATFYRAPEMEMLIPAPVSEATVFLGRFYECVFMSSWAVAFLGSPVLLAYGLERDAPATFYGALLAFYLPFVVIAAALGSMIAILLVQLLARLRRALAWLLAALVLIVLGVLLRDAIEPPDLGDAASVPSLVTTMARSEAPYLPSFWLAQGVLDAAEGRPARAAGYVALLLVGAVLSLGLATALAARWLYPGYSALRGAGASAERSRTSWSWLDGVLRPLPLQTRSLIVKDVKLFWRDPAQWSQFLLFFGILVLYVVNLRDAGAAYHREPWRGWIALLNVSACLLVLATLTTRFVYPLISLEGHRFWILDLAPVRRRSLVWQKFLTSVALCSLFTLALALLSAWQLELERTLATLSVASVALATTALSGLAVGLGSLYPHFGEDSPARIVSGMGGTLNFILSMVYVTLIAAALAIVIHAPRLAAFAHVVPSWLVPAAVVWMVSLTLLATALPLWLGMRHLERVEV